MFVFGVATLIEMLLLLCFFFLFILFVSVFYAVASVQAYLNWWYVFMSYLLWIHFNNLCFLLEFLVTCVLYRRLNSSIFYVVSCSYFLIRHERVLNAITEVAELKHSPRFSPIIEALRQENTPQGPQLMVIYLFYICERKKIIHLKFENMSVLMAVW